MADVNFSQLTSASAVGANDQLLIRLNNALSGSAGFARVSLSALNASSGDGTSREVDADATLTNTDLVILVSASSNDVTLTLPKASLHVGKVLYIRVLGTDGGSYTVTLTRNPTDSNINGSATPVSSTLSTKSWVLVAGANGWYTVVG